MRKGLTIREQVRQSNHPLSRKRKPKSAPVPVEAPSYPEIFTTIVLPAGRAEGAPTNRSW
jgi:hypothetical protein